MDALVGFKIPGLGTVLADDISFPAMRFPPPEYTNPLAKTLDAGIKVLFEMARVLDADIITHDHKSLNTQAFGEYARNMDTLSGSLREQLCDVRESIQRSGTGPESSERAAAVANIATRLAGHLERNDLGIDDIERSKLSACVVALKTYAAMPFDELKVRAA